jgi:DNA-binding transcriptional regulator YdaS (Cro superfamily)
MPANSRVPDPADFSAQMPNDRLKNSLRKAGLTSEQFAEIITVDPKTVQRWVAGRTPYPKHRTTKSRALDVPEHDLWPDVVPPPPAETATTERPAVGDVTGSWGQSSHPDAPDHVSLLADRVERIDVLDADGAQLSAEGLLDALRDQAFDGCEARLLTPTPAQQLATLVGQDGIELRIATTPSTLAFLRADDTMLVTIPLAGAGDPILLQLRRLTDAGAFDRLTDHFEALWHQASPVTNPRQLIEAAARARGSTLPHQQPSWPPPADTQAAPSSPSPRPAPRRWPGRRD